MSKLQGFFAVALSFDFAGLTAVFAIPMANAERGYHAFGGEYILIIFAAYLGACLGSWLGKKLGK